MIRRMFIHLERLSCLTDEIVLLIQSALPRTSFPWGTAKGAGYKKIGMLETFDFRGEMGKFMDMLFDIMGNS